jgi:hypothetical protein
MADKVSELELKNIIGQEINNSMGYMGGNLSSQRKKSLEYYMGEPLGTEIDGRSQVVSTDVADTVETILPNLLKIFTASDQTVKCEPVKAEDVALAEQATNYINYIFNKDNNGFSILYTWFKDALIEKNGIVKVYWDESEKVEQETYENLNEQEYQILIDNDDVEVVEEESFVDEKAKEQLEQIKALAEAQGQVMEDIPTPKLYNCIIKRTTSSGKVKIENIPPEEFLIERNAKTIEDANFVAHRVLKTRSDLIQMGFDRDVVDDLPTQNTVTMNDERLARFADIDESSLNDAPDESTQDIEIYECYVKIDMDGDGIAELRKVIVAGGNANTILENMPCDFIPFCSLTPIPMPHRFYGRSVSELVEDVQLVKSTVMRQLLDNMYLTNNNRVAIMDGMVNLDDLLTSRPGGVVRTKQPPSQVMMPMQSQTISQQAFPLLEFRRIFELTVKYQNKERIVELNNKFVPVSPTEWKNRYNISINVGLGAGSKDQQIVMLNNILQKQLQAFQLQGNKEYPMVTLKNIYNSLAKIIEEAGLKNVENYFVNPDEGRELVQPSPPPEPTPIEKIEFTRIASEEKRKVAELELESRKLKADTAASILGFETKIKEMELKYNTQLDAAKIKADADIEKLVTSNRNKTFLAAQQSSDRLDQQVDSLDGQQRTRQAQPGTEPSEQG